MAKEMKRVEATVKTEVAEIVKPQKSEGVNNASIADIDALKKQVEMLQALLLANNNVATPQPTNSQSVDGYIRADRSIKVMSLTSSLLNISTMGGGKGKPFSFKQYGDVKNIIYSDLAEILHHYQKFAEAGAFYIFDEEVVKRHGLESVYENILDKKAIDTFLDRDVEDIKEIFSNVSDMQKDTIVKNIVKKIVAGDDVSSNKINVIKDIYGADIFQMADEMANWEGNVEELDK